jgi:putative transcriptional regulator
MPRSEKELRARDAKRNIGKELLQAIRDVKVGRQRARHPKVLREIPPND